MSLCRFHSAGHSFSRATDDFEMRVWTSRGWSGTPTNCAPHEHDEIGWFTEREARSMRLADSRVSQLDRRSPVPPNDEGMHRGRLQATHHPVKNRFGTRSRWQLPNALTLADRTSPFPTQGPKPRLCSAETPGEVVFSSSEP